jgi:hypothetical protein
MGRRHLWVDSDGHGLAARGNDQRIACVERVRSHQPKRTLRAAEQLSRRRVEVVGHKGVDGGFDEGRHGID